jgi:Na+/H+ antiporter NhaD/arsenite permease-like protein
MRWTSAFIQIVKVDVLTHAHAKPWAWHKSPSGIAMPDSWRLWVTLAGFLVTYAGLAVGKVPGLRIDRAGIALVGAAFLLATGVVSFKEAVENIDFATIALLLGMMIVVAYLRSAGFFDRLAGLVLGRVHGPYLLLAATMGLSGLLSAFLVNDVVCVALTPLVLHLARRLGLDPIPHLIGVAIASNIGSTATLTGNPQNMMIGNLSKISYLHFAAKLAPIAVLGMALGYAVVAIVSRGRLATRYGATKVAETKQPSRAPHRRLLAKSLAVTIGVVVLFFAGAPMEVTALGAAAVLLLSRVNPKRIFGQVDWGLLVMFAGLFVVVHAFKTHVVAVWGLDRLDGLREGGVLRLSVVAAVLSNLVSNVPAVLLFQPIVVAMEPAAQESAWLTLAMSSTLAGNLTVLGSVANLIVVESAMREGVTVSFVDYLKAGVPVTVLTLAVGIVWLCFVG